MALPLLGQLALLLVLTPTAQRAPSQLAVAASTSAAACLCLPQHLLRRCLQQAVSVNCSRMQLHPHHALAALLHHHAATLAAADPLRQPLPAHRSWAPWLAVQLRAPADGMPTRKAAQ